MKISLLTALISLAAISCAGKTGGQVAIDGGSGGASVIACSSDGQCGSTRSCFANRCVDRLDPQPSWAVELNPPPVRPPPLAETPVPTVTELLSVNGSPVVLSANSTVPLTVQFAADSTSATAVPTMATVILTVPSQIPGRPALSFQADFVPTKRWAILAVPPNVLGQQATVNLIPLPPADVTTPPYTFPAVPIPTSGQTVNAGMLSGASFKISGRLVDPVNEAARENFTARAFQGDLLASTTAVTSPVDGGFTIYLAAGSGPVNLQLLPATGAFDPWLTLAQIPLAAGPKDLGPIALPPHPMTNAFQVTVHGTTDDQRVANAAVRAVATTFTGGDSRATFKYLRDGSTDANGNAQLDLIPGDSQTALNYAVSVAPPAGSPWTTQCASYVPVLYNGSAREFTLLPRPVVSGTLLSADGAPVANAVVTATTGAAADTLCLLGPATTSVITDATGAFKLALDPGHYQLDYDPPTGSPAPRWTEPYEVVANIDANRTVRLPPPALFEGDLEDALDNPLPFTTIRIFEPNCPSPTSCAPPTLRGQAQSDADGHFRAIVWAP